MAWVTTLHEQNTATKYKDQLDTRGEPYTMHLVGTAWVFHDLMSRSSCIYCRNSTTQRTIKMHVIEDSPSETNHGD